MMGTVSRRGGAGRGHSVTGGGSSIEVWGCSLQPTLLSPSVLRSQQGRREPISKCSRGARVTTPSANPPPPFLWAPPPRRCDHCPTADF